MIKTKTLLLLILFFTSISPLFSQSQNSDLANWEVLIRRQIKYPLEAIRAKKEGLVVIALDTDEQANLRDITLDKKSSPFFDDQVLTAVENVRDFWRPVMLSDRTPGERYLVVLNFEIVQKGKTKKERINSAVNLVQKGKPEQALKIAEWLVKEYPYDAKSRELRSQINRQLGNEDAATADLISYWELQSQVLIQLDFQVFQQVSTRIVTGSF